MLELERLAPRQNLQQSPATFPLNHILPSLSLAGT